MYISKAVVASIGGEAFQGSSRITLWHITYHSLFWEKNINKGGKKTHTWTRTATQTQKHTEYTLVKNLVNGCTPRKRPTIFMLIFLMILKSSEKVIYIYIYIYK